MTGTNKFAEYMRLLRLWNGGIAILGLLLGATVAIGVSGLSGNIQGIALGALVVVLFVGAGNSLNDYFDVETDKVAHPNRPLPKGALSRKTALYSAAIMFALCIALSVFINLVSLLIVVLAIIAMISYELKLKASGLPGNIMIAVLVAALFEFAGATVGKVEMAAILASLSALATLGREIVKDIEDMEGDKTRNTLPRRIGSRRAGFVAIVPTVAAVALSPLPFIFSQLTVLYIAAVAVADALFIYACYHQLKDPHAGQKIYKVAMVVALVAFAVGVQI